MADCIVFLGIDPGKSGGMAALDEGVATAGLAMTDRQVWEWLGQYSPGENTAAQVFAVIEKVSGFIAGNPAPGSAMFNFGRGVGLLHGFLVAAGIPYEEVTPQRWQKALGIPARGRTESKTQFKQRLKQKAQQLFPQENVTLATADALLIAEFCRRKREGKL